HTAAPKMKNTVAAPRNDFIMSSPLMTQPRSLAYSNRHILIFWQDSSCLGISRENRGEGHPSGLRQLILYQLFCRGHGMTRKSRNNTDRSVKIRDFRVIPCPPGDVPQTIG